MKAWLRLLVPVILTAVVSVLCVLAYENYALWLPPPHADEAGHALPAARMAFDLRRGDFASFLSDTQREMGWPFVHSWYVAAFFVARGVSTEVARASSLVAFGAAMLAAFLLARELREPSEAGLVGTLSVTLMAVTTGFWTHSSSIMVEPLGMTLTLTCLLSGAVAERRGSAAGALVTGLLAALTLLTKYNYGLPLIAALVLSAVLGRRIERTERRALALLLAGIAMPVAAWFVYPFPDKLQALYGFSINRDEGLSGLTNLLFYPTEMARLVSWPLTLWLFAALLLSLRRPADARLRPVVLFAVLDLAVITLHPNKQERYMFTALPVLYVLGELELARIVGRWLPSPRTRAAIWAGALLLAFVTLDPRPALWEDRRDQQRLRPASEIVDFIVTRLRPGDRTLVVGSTGLLPHLLVQWELITRYGNADAVVDNLPFPGSAEWDTRYRRGYPAEMAPDYQPLLETALRSGGYDRVASLGMAADSVFNPDWLKRWDAWGQNYVLLMERQALYPLVAERPFPESGVRVRLYAKP